MLKKQSIKRHVASLAMGTIVVSGLVNLPLGTPFNQVVHAADQSLETSRANWPQTNGQTLVGSGYNKLETRNFSVEQTFSKDYAATPKLQTQKDLTLFIKGVQQDINSLPTDGTGGKPKLIKTSEMGSDTYFYAANIMSVLKDDHYVDVDLKLTVLSVDLGNDETTVGFGVKGASEPGNTFLSTGSGNQIAQRGNFTHFHYQFFEHGTNTPIAVKFHMGFTDIDFNEAIKIQETVVNKLYVDQKSILPYTIVDDKLAITRDFNDIKDKRDNDTIGQTHVILMDIDAPKDGFDLDISTSGHDNTPGKEIAQGSKVAPSILGSMKYEGLVVTSHVDKDGKELADRVIKSDTISNPYQTNPQDIPGYRLVETPKNANGTYTDGKIDVTYVYVKQSDLVVKHVDQSGKELRPSTKETGDIESDYQTTVKEIPGYVLVAQPENASGKYADGTTEVTYVYAKQVDLVTKYIDESGNTLSPSTAETGKVGDDYHTTAKEIPGYTLVEQPKNADGKYIDGTNEVTYVYVKQGNLITKFIDESGKELRPSLTETDKVGSDYQTVAKSIPGYELVAEPTNAAGQYIDGTTEVIYVYAPVAPEPEKKQGDLITKYVDQSGKELRPTTTEAGDVGEEYHTAAQIIPGYKLVEQPRNADGKYVDGTTEVTYVYVKQADLIIKHVDQSGKELRPTTTDKGNVGGDYHTTAQEIPGYKLVEQPKNADGKHIDGTTEVTYVYVKQADLITKHVDQSGKELRPTTTDKGNVGGEYHTTAQEIPGYKLVEQPKNGDGKYVDGTTEVTYVYMPVKTTPEEINKPETEQSEKATPDKTPQETQTKSNQESVQTHAVAPVAELPKTGETKDKTYAAVLSAIAALFLITFYKRFKKQK